jgi:CubicO group peptidase (beta-lactamase class C family)
VKRSHAIGIATGFVLLPYAARADDAITPEQRASLAQLVAEASQAPQTVGFSVAVARGGTIAYQAARGKRDLDPDASATVDTWYCIGSVTKQFTAALIMQLVEAHRLALDDKLATIVPAFPHATEITFRQLLTHTSGLSEYVGEAYTAGLLDKKDVTPAALVALLAGKPLEFTPGTLFEYSNSNYLALGMTIEKLYAKSYAQVLRERIVQPLGLEVSAGPPPSGTIARGYTAAVTPTPMPQSDISWAFAAGELFATVSGLLAWDRALFGGHVVSTASLAQMTTPVKLPNGRSTDYGFGLSVVTALGHRVVSHNGGVPGGFAAQNFVFPDDGIAIVTLANTMDFNIALPATKIADVFLPGINVAVESLSQERVAEMDDPAIRARARDWLERLRTGKIDASQMTPQMGAALTPAALKSAQNFLTTAGPVTAFKLTGFALQGGYRVYVYSATTATAHMAFQFALDQQNKIAGLLLTP